MTQPSLDELLQRADTARQDAIRALDAAINAQTTVNNRLPPHLRNDANWTVGQLRRALHCAQLKFTPEDE